MAKFFNKVKRVAKRAFKKVRGKLIKRYFKKGYSPKVSRIIKDVSFLKSIVNAEKKRYTTNSLNSPLTVAQVNGNSSGHQYFDATPLPGQGTGYNQRTGNSIKWHSVHFTFQFSHQSSADQANKLTIYLVKTVGRIYSTASNFLSEFMNPNPFISVGSTVWDTNASRVPETYKNFIVLKKKNVFLPADSITGQNLVKTINMGFKFKNHHVRWATDNTTITDGQVWFLVLGMNGNSSPTVASTFGSGVPIKAVNTGAQFNYVQTNYYYDN